MRHARPALGTGAVPRHPDDLAEKAVASEYRITQDLGLVHRAMIEVKPEQPRIRERLPHGPDARLEEGNEAVDAAPLIDIGLGARGAGLFAAHLTRPGARGKGGSHVEGRVDIAKVNPSPLLGGKCEQLGGVAPNEEIAHARHSGGNESTPKKALICSSAAGHCSDGAFSNHGQCGPPSSHPATDMSGGQATRRWK